MLQFTPLQTTDKDYSFVENLLHESFPEAERRDDEHNEIMWITVQPLPAT